jgi:hypothetical protein
VHPATGSCKRTSSRHFLNLDPSADEIDEWLRRSAQEMAAAESVEVERAPEPRRYRRLRHG